MRLSLSALCLTLWGLLGVTSSTYGSSRWFLPKPEKLESYLEVQAAHKSYIEGNSKEFSVALKEAFIAHPADEAAQSNLFELLDRSFENRRGKALPVSWKLPPELNGLKLSIRRKQNSTAGPAISPTTLSSSKDQPKFSMAFTLSGKSRSAIEQVQLTHYPSEILIDKRAGYGRVTALSANECQFETENTESAPKEGLYLFHIQLKGKEPVRGWFLLRPSRSNEAPRPEFSTKNGLVWVDFKSQAYRPYEARKLSIKLIEDKTGNAIWDSGSVNPEMEKLAWEELIKKNYPVSDTKGVHLLLNFQETHKFGELLISRENWVNVPGNPLR